MLKRIIRVLLPNPFDALLKKAACRGKKSFLIVWNRGLGDIPLGIYALVWRIKQFIPLAAVTIVTRQDLLEGFELLSGVEILPIPFWTRKNRIDLDSALELYGKSKKDWDLVIESPDPTYWVQWQLGVLTPKLCWDSDWDSLCLGFDLDPNHQYVGVHIHSETVYGYEKNWPAAQFNQVFSRIFQDYRKKIILFGSGSGMPVEEEGVIDLRGKTSLKQMLSIIKNQCSHLLLPDSGILSMTYYLDCSFPIHVVSLWADPFQGVLKQNVSSPNPGLIHIPLIAKNGDLRNIGVQDVIDSLFIEAMNGK